MHARWLLFVAPLAIACDGKAPIGSNGNLDDADRNAIITAHNVARGRVDPAAAPAIPDIAWDDAAATVAAAYSQKCTFEHNPNRGPYGENIFANSGDTFLAKAVVEGWESEKQYYDYASNGCQTGKVCGHYTQVVWRNSTGVGCGMQICDVNSPFPDFPHWQIWVCDYSPPGNYVGQKPY